MFGTNFSRNGDGLPLSGTAPVNHVSAGVSAESVVNSPTHSDSADLFATNWESAWIDIGGEG
jgi:hypothetical protein